jgi:hypothetical protein
MLLLELGQEVELLLLVARGLASLLLALVEHHLLDHAARLAVEVAQLAVLGLDLAGVDLGGRGDDVRPPLHLVGFVEVHLDVLASGRGREGPRGLVEADGVGELALGLSAAPSREITERTLMKGSWPLTPTFRVLRPMCTSRSLPLYLASM